MPPLLLLLLVRVSQFGCRRRLRPVHVSFVLVFLPYPRLRRRFSFWRRRFSFAFFTPMSDADGPAPDTTRFFFFFSAAAAAAATTAIVSRGGV